MKNRKGEKSSLLAASLPSALPSTEKHDFAAVINVNNLPEDLQILMSPHVKDLNADLLEYEQRHNTLDYTPNIASAEPEFL